VRNDAVYLSKNIPESEKNGGWILATTGLFLRDSVNGRRPGIPDNAWPEGQSYIM
jgi:hypothetical protein